jgi:DNA-directed RNA polymerase specialized sigma24 family protein
MEGAVDVAPPTTSDDVGHRRLTEAVRHGLERLAPMDRRVIIELYYQGRSAPETAAVLGLSDAAVRSRAYHALRHLHSILVRGAGR